MSIDKKRPAIVAAANRKRWGGVASAAAILGVLSAGCGDILHEIQRDHIMEIGVPAQARVVALGGTGTTINHVQVLRIKLEVLPNPAANSQGPTVPYAVETRERVPIYAIARVQPGATISVKYDPADPTKVAIDYQAMGYLPD